jgi:hypothetical protein
MKQRSFQMLNHDTIRRSNAFNELLNVPGIIETTSERQRTNGTYMVTDLTLGCSYIISASGYIRRGWGNRGNLTQGVVWRRKVAKTDNVYGYHFYGAKTFTTNQEYIDAFKLVASRIVRYRKYSEKRYGSSESCIVNN